METHAKVRMDILIEAPLEKRLSRLLDQHGVSGYTVFAAVGGRGGNAFWLRAGQINDVGQMVLFTCLMDVERREPVLEAVYEKLASHIGFVTTSDVQVIRPSKFP